MRRHSTLTRMLTPPVRHLRYRTEKRELHLLSEGFCTNSVIVVSFLNGQNNADIFQLVCVRSTQEYCTMTKVAATYTIIVILQLHDRAVYPSSVSRTL